MLMQFDRTTDAGRRRSEINLIQRRTALAVCKQGQTDVDRQQTTNLAGPERRIDIVLR